MSAPLMNLLSKLEGKKRQGEGQWVAKCPGHPDKVASLSIGLNDLSGNVLVTCHAGCDINTILSAVNMTVADLFEPSTRTPETKERSRDLLSDTYDYTDANGDLIMQVLRYITPDGGKTFRQRQPDGKGGWTWSTTGLKKPLYRLKKLTENPGEHFWLCEGEKDVHTLEDFGHIATTNPGGAGKWDDTWTKTLSLAEKVTIVVDNDEPGIKHGVLIAAELTELGVKNRILKAPNGYKDISQYVGSGGTPEGLVKLDHVETPVPVSEFQRIADLVTDLRASNRPDNEKLARLERSLTLTKVECEPLKIESWAQLLERPEEPYDWIIPEFIERGDRIIMVAPEGAGKLLDVDTPIPTPTGWTTMGAINVGDYVFDDKGHPTRVIAVSDIDDTHPCYELVFDDGSQIVAADTHLWRTVDYWGRQEGRWAQEIRSTEEIAKTLKARDGHVVNHAVGCAHPLQYGHQILPIDPWLLGYWLGNGSAVNGQISVGKHDIEWFLTRCPGKYNPNGDSVSVKGLRVPLRENGLLGNKHIPEIYLRASVEQRLELLRGLLDSDGHISPTSPERKRGAAGGHIEYCSCSKTENNKLADGAWDLVLGLGIKATKHVSDAKLYGRVTSQRTRITFFTELPVFSLPRKLERIGPLRTRRGTTRYIVEARPLPPRPCICIQVEAESSMYLAGENCIPTHNSMLLRQIAVCTSFGVNWLDNKFMPKGMNTLVVDLENPPKLIARKSKLIYETAHKLTSMSSKPPVRGRSDIIMQPQGMNLLTEEDKARLENAIQQSRPDLVLLGPLYKSFIDPGGQTSEAVIGQIVRFFDYLRIEYGFALWLEHHPPMGDSWVGRPMRPFGSSVWSRWPELGLTMVPDIGQVDSGPPQTYTVGTFRGSRDDRRLPRVMSRGRNGFPFTVDHFAQ